MNRLFSVRMRASAGGRHISGAEIISPEDLLATRGESLLKRAVRHARGQVGEIHLQAELLNREEIQYLKTLPVHTIKTQTAEEGRKAALEILEQLGLAHGREILARMEDAAGLRGALLLDADTLERLDDSGNSGVRATRMDGLSPQPKDRKDHFREALTLATKVVNAPGIVAEICISDDPDYVTGYVASRQLGYRRITTLKESGDENGGRIFLYRGEREKVQDCIDYLRNQPVLVNDLPADRDRWTTLRKRLAERKNADLYREIPAIRSAPGPYVEYADRRALLLSSNDYLDLANDERVKKYAAEMTERYGAGTGAARLVSGSTPLHDELENMLAEWKGVERALLFNTGYMANLGVISALCDRDWVIFSDELNHASIIDGCRLSRAQIVVYKHNDMEDLAHRAHDYCGCNGLIVSDAVFSMAGDIVDLPGLLTVAEKYDFLSMLDEAHANGVVGATGRGVTEYFGLCPDILVGTCSKALGSEGGFVCGDSLLIEFLINYARSFVFSTTLPSGSVAATLKALEILQDEPERIRRLQDNTCFFVQCLRARGIEITADTAIVPIIVGDERMTLNAAARLKEAGFYISAIRYPTVPRGQALLRVSLMSAHTQEDLRAAAEAIAKAIKQDMVMK